MFYILAVLMYEVGKIVNDFAIGSAACLMFLVVLAHQARPRIYCSILCERAEILWNGFG